MTREEAIKICAREKECVQRALGDCADRSGYVSPDGIITALDYVEALDMAIAALRAQDALLAEIKGMCHLCRHYNHGIGYKPCDNCDGGNNFEWRGAKEEV